MSVPSSRNSETFSVNMRALILTAHHAPKLLRRRKCCTRLGWRTAGESSPSFQEFSLWSLSQYLTLLKNGVKLCPWEPHRNQRSSLWKGFCSQRAETFWSVKDQNFDLGKSISCWTRFGQTDGLKGLWQTEGQTLYLSPLGLVLSFDRVCAFRSVAFSCHHIFRMVFTPMWGDAIPLFQLEVCKAGFFSLFRLDCSFVY